MESKRLHQRLAKQHFSVRSSGQVAAALNESHHFNSVGFDFPEINRASSIFPPLDIGGEKQLRKMCEIQYFWFDESGRRCREDGVFLCRKVPSMPGTTGAKFEVYDLRIVQPGGKLCLCCSKDSQRPVRHGKDLECPSARAFQHNSRAGSENVETNENLKRLCMGSTGPDPARIQGQQSNKAYVANIKKPQGSHPCLFVDSNGVRCLSGHYYNNENAANKHMRDVHKINAWDDRIYFTPSPADKFAFPCKHKRCKKGYKSASSANKHMLDVGKNGKNHAGTPPGAPEFELYPVVSAIVKAKAGKVGKGKKKEEGEEE